ncbi:MAG: ferritin [Lachnospirales bacterium]
MDNKLIEQVNLQINNEIYSSHLYLSMAAWAHAEGWSGFGRWLYLQADEESKHSLAMFDHLVERDAVPELFTVDAPAKDFKSLEDCFTKVLAHEKKISSLINTLATIALESKDHAFYDFIQNFVREQIEEEATAKEILTRIKRASGNVVLLDSLDIELGKRQPSTFSINGGETL